MSCIDSSFTIEILPQFPLLLLWSWLSLAPSSEPRLVWVSCAVSLAYTHHSLEGGTSSRDDPEGSIIAQRVLESPGASSPS